MPKSYLSLSLCGGGGGIFKDDLIKSRVICKKDPTKFNTFLFQIYKRLNKKKKFKSDMKPC